jgi:hypothetical protein
MDFIKNAASSDAHVFYGQVFDDALEDRFMVTVIATGFPPARREATRLARARGPPTESGPPVWEGGRFRFPRRSNGRRWKCPWGMTTICAARRICGARCES